ncbi:MAG: DNA primase [Bryobacteraceae bacterium]
MDFVEQIKSQVDIVKTIGEYVRLKRSGASGRYGGLCPFHQEKTPSFSVNQTRQFYKCFGCGVGGDVLKFVMEIEGVTFPEALKLLADRNGIAMPRRAEYGDAESKMRAAVFEMHAIAASLFQSNLRGPQGAEARAYLAKRGVIAEMIDLFGLGFAEFSGQALARRLGDFTREQIDASGLLRRREDGSTYDSFRGRLMFPIQDESGKTIAFGGRAMRAEDQPKYLNSPETPVYRKTSVLYNVSRAREGMRKSGRAVLVEGYMDAIGVYSAGIKEVVASCGTALTNPQVRTIHRHTDTVVVNFDPDAAGANAAERAIQLLLDEGLHVRVLTLDGGLDPDEYVKQNGAEAYRAKLDAASGYFHWLADRARARFDMRSAEGRMDALKFLLPAVQRISDKLERAAIAADLASYLGVETGMVLDQFRKAAAGRSAAAGSGTVAATPAIPASERMLLNALLQSEQARAEVLPALSEAILPGFAAREIFEALRRAETAEFSELVARLSPSGQTLLHEIASADEEMEDTRALEQARACLRRIEKDIRKKRAGELRARVKTAEREGHVEEALHLMAELERMAEMDRAE